MAGELGVIASDAGVTGGGVAVSTAVDSGAIGSAGCCAEGGVAGTTTGESRAVVSTSDVAGGELAVSTAGDSGVVGSAGCCAERGWQGLANPVRSTRLLV
jgi:hypothetical protein